MAQKDKVKELVGRGLDSYHTKALQQIDRIEKKNKEQNHKISILTNELDNDYLTKTEEGSVISLEHSKEGMVYLDELQGNTLVNYCTDGVKELTLNGDINAEGTSVTLAEGVDNGKVDVVCEGNTLVNLFDKNIPFTRGKHQNIEGANIYYQKEIPMATNGTFHIIAPIGDKSSNSNDARLMILKYNKTNNAGTVVRDYTGNSNPSLNLVVSLTSEEVLLFNCWNITDDNFNRNYPTMMVLEGDWTNKEIPPYFEGMKSVGELEDNKIETLSRNKNLFDGELELGSISTSHGGNITNARCLRSKNYIKVRPNTTIIQSNDLGYESIVYIYDKDKNLIAYLGSKNSFTIPENGEYIRFRSSTGNTENNLNVKYQLEEGSVDTSYVPHSLNKKEISLNEPLRALPNGVTDKIVKIGGKWYIHRRLYGITLNGGENEKWNIGFTNFGTPIFTWNNTGINICRTESYHSVLSDRFIYGKQYSSTEENHKCIYVYNYEGLDDSIRIQYPLNSVEEFRTYLSSNPINVIIQLEVPIYEELPIDLTLNTYNDITHISNNSTIPCNMKVTNTGYNAIIKPSAQYTVAFDTNTSGEVGINLGGSKVITNNNVATVTTPSTLTDDSLRLYGKGIKASKIRLLEGDKTNWIPSYFEGMESCFEDKLQDDGTYKMEILSYINNYIKTLGEGHSVKNIYLCSTDSIQPYLKYFNLVDNYNECNNLFDYYYVSNNSSIWINLGTFNRTNALYILNQKISECEGKQNKIQFSSIEPLRGIGDVKDRFVFKDGKLMIERNCGEVVVNGDYTKVTPAIGNTSNVIYIDIPDILGSVSENIPNAICNNRVWLMGSGSNWGSSPHNTFVVRPRATSKSVWFIVPTDIVTLEMAKEYLNNNPTTLVYQLAEPTYEEITPELQKIILEGYENGTLFFDTNIPPTVTTTYAGETPIVKATKLNKTEVLKNTDDINDNIVPYLMDMDFRVVCLQLEGGIENVSMARLFGGTYEMLKRDILSNRYSKEEYKYRLDAYLSANKITHEEYTKLGDMLND